MRIKKEKKPAFALILIFLSVNILVATEARAEKSIFEMVIAPPPDPSPQLSTLYEDRTHHTIMELDDGKIKDDQIFFYDGNFVFDVDSKQATNLAYSANLLEKFLDLHKLSQLPIYYGGSSLSNGISISYSYIDGTKCQWPYPSLEKIEIPRRPPLNLMFVHRLEKPVTKEYQFWCERGPGVISLTTSFEESPFIVQTDYQGNALLAFRKPASVFRINTNESTIGHHLGRDLIVFPSALSEHLLTMAADAQLDPQEAVELLEAEIRVIDSK